MIISVSTLRKLLQLSRKDHRERLYHGVETSTLRMNYSSYKCGSVVTVETKDMAWTNFEFSINLSRWEPIAPPPQWWRRLMSKMTRYAWYMKKINFLRELVIMGECVNALIYFQPNFSSIAWKKTFYLYKC